MKPLKKFSSFLVCLFVASVAFSCSSSADEPKTSPEPTPEPDKKLVIAWYGTSIPAGYPYEDDPYQWSYANKAVVKLGEEIQNRCVSGSTLMYKPGVANFQGLAFTNSAFDKGYVKNMLDLIGTADEPDWFVFDFGANDGQFDKEYFKNLDLDNLDWSDKSSETFLGAYNLVITQLLSRKKDAKIILFTHYSDDADEPVHFPNARGGYKKMNDLIVAIGEHYGIPVCDVRKHTGWTLDSLTTWCQDGIHPAAGKNKKSVDVLTEIAYDFLKNTIIGSGQK